MEKLTRITEGNKTFELTGKTWSNGTPIRRLISESCSNWDEFDNDPIEESYICPNTGLRMSLTGEILEDN